MRFHARGGASPARTLPGYKKPAGGPTRHGEDVVMMRYARDEAGEWPAPRPEMRLRSMGPMQRQLSQAVRRLRLRRLRPSRTPLSDLRASGQRLLRRGRHEESAPDETAPAAT
jgi:hypothetical protein